MKRLFYTLAALAAMVLSACSERAEEPQTAPFGGAALSVTLSRAAGTEADAADAIDPHALAVVLRQGAKAESLAPEQIYSLESALAFTVYCDVEALLASGRLDPALPIDVEVYANVSAAPTAAAAPEQTFTRASVAAAGARVPMFGFKHGVGPLVPGTLTDAGTIHLLRAAAKVSVELSPALAANYEFVSAPTLVNGSALIPAEGFVAPAPEAWASLSATSELTAEAMFRPMPAADGATSAALAFTPQGAAYVLYLPEAEQPAGNTRELGIDVKLRSKTDHAVTSTGRLYFADYTPEGLLADPAGKTAFRLVRNHHYSFTIVDVQTDYELRCVVAESQPKEIIVPVFE